MSCPGKPGDRSPHARSCLIWGLLLYSLLFLSFSFPDHRATRSALEHESHRAETSGKNPLTGPRGPPWWRSLPRWWLRAQAAGGRAQAPRGGLPPRLGGRVSREGKCLGRRRGVTSSWMVKHPASRVPVRVCTRVPVRAGQAAPPHLTAFLTQQPQPAPLARSRRVMGPSAPGLSQLGRAWRVSLRQQQTWAGHPVIPRLREPEAEGSWPPG